MIRSQVKENTTYTEISNLFKQNVQEALRRLLKRNVRLFFSKHCKTRMNDAELEVDSIKTSSTGLFPKKRERYPTNQKGDFYGILQFSDPSFIVNYNCRKRSLILLSSVIILTKGQRLSLRKCVMDTRYRLERQLSQLV